MPFLSWISDEILNDAVQHLINVAETAREKSENDFEKNVIDPFSALFQISGFGIDYKNWLMSEKTRQAQKTFQNHIGEFHQVILGNVNGWANLKTGGIVDLVSSENKMLAEIKNKHNTVKGANLSDLYKSLEDLVMPKSSIYKDYTAYYVTIIPKKPERFDLPFIPSDKSKGEKCKENPKIRIIDGASFYSLVTGEPNALKDLFEILPEVFFLCSKKEIDQGHFELLQKHFTSAFGPSFG